MASKEERDARLDELDTAIKAWATKRRTYLQGQASLSKRILRGRSGSDRLNDKSVQKASELLVDEIDQFLAGE